jgi:hypothetical protein
MGNMRIPPLGVYLDNVFLPVRGVQTEMSLDRRNGLLFETSIT